MKLDIVLTPEEASEERLSGRMVAVIDVFRATSCICTAMEHGARRLIPLTSIDECLSLRGKLANDETVLLGGERKTKLIDGFDLDNSPFSYSSDRVSGATIIMSTTNGTRAINTAEHAGAARVAVGAFLNARAVAEYLGSAGLDIAILCAGRHNRFTMEDALCAGYIASVIESQHTCELTDIAWSMADFATRYNEDLRVPLRNCMHYNQIIETGLADDVAFCLQRDVFTSVPFVSDGAILI